MFSNTFPTFLFGHPKNNNKKPTTTNHVRKRILLSISTVLLFVVLGFASGKFAQLFIPSDKSNTAITCLCGMGVVAGEETDRTLLCLALSNGHLDTMCVFSLFLNLRNASCTSHVLWVNALVFTFFFPLRSVQSNNPSFFFSLQDTPPKHPKYRDGSGGAEGGISIFFLF